MHGAQKIWCDSIKEKFPDYFLWSKVLDVGSLDVNGTNRYLFEDSNYIGVDIVKGPGVDIVSPAHEIEEEDFDVVLSTSALEHDMFWFLTVIKMVRALKHNGLMFFSCAYSQREHGTIIRKPMDSGTAKLQGDWSKYYRNLRVMEVYSVLNPERSFGSYMIGITGRDLRFWGIKR